MDKKYEEEFTKDWELLAGDGTVEIWKFFDTVEWKEMYAIKINGVIKTSFDRSKGNPYDIHHIVSKCFA